MFRLTQGAFFMEAHSPGPAPSHTSQLAPMPTGTSPSLPGSAHSPFTNRAALTTQKPPRITKTPKNYPSQAEGEGAGLPPSWGIHVNLATANLAKISHCCNLAYGHWREQRMN